MDTRLINDIKFNCDVSDAKYWGYFSICGLLMRYRDLFRSERGLNPWDEIRRNEISDWIQRKESHWPEIESAGLRDLTIGGRTYDPFDVAAINDALRPGKLIYGAGYGMYMKPTFFLADLSATADLARHPVFTADREYARDLFSTAGMLQGRCIFLRLEPLTVLLWEKFQESKARPGSSLSDAFSQYGLGENVFPGGEFHDKLRHTADQYAAVLIRHELAESMEDVPLWKDLLADAGDRDVEHFVRAVKDLIADTSVHGPLKQIIESRDRAGLSLSIALMDGFRRLLYPEIRKAFEHFIVQADWPSLEDARETGYEKFLLLREEIIGLYRTGSGSDEFIRGIRSLIQRLL
jgi:hypothetical protein